MFEIYTLGARKCGKCNWGVKSNSHRWYKRGKKTGNWITEDCKTHKTPSIAYKWGAERIKDIIELAEHKEHKIEHKVCSENKKNKI